MSRNKMHVDEVDISPELVRDMLLKQFPEWADLPLFLMHPEGTDNAMYKLGKDKLVRLPRTEGSSFNIEKELTWLPVLGPQLPIPIPRIIGEGKAEAHYPFPWLVCEWVEGSNPNEEGMIDEHIAATELATFVKAMHQIKADGAPTCGRGKPLGTRHQEIQQFIPLLSELYDTNLLKKLWESVCHVPHWEKDSVWIHGDLHSGNLLVNNRQLKGIVDWGLAGIGDPACDMMVAWTLLGGKGREIFHSIVRPDDHTWMRGRSWALFLGIVGYPYYRSTNPIFARIAKRALDEVIKDSF